MGCEDFCQGHRISDEELSLLKEAEELTGISITTTAGYAAANYVLPFVEERRRKRQKKERRKQKKTKAILNRVFGKVP